MQYQDHDKILRIAAFDFTNILLTGESGVGKTYYAEQIHRASARSGKKFLAINCASIPAELLESELFGSVKGAFTGATGSIGKFEAADGGTVFLDEIGELDPRIQAKLLTVIEDKTIWRVGSNTAKKLNIRFIFATNQNRRAFRDDFFYRIQGFSVEVKPLRERRDEIKALAKKFLTDFNREQGKELYFTEDVFKFLRRQNWYGNVRELKSYVIKLCLETLLADQTRIDRHILTIASLPEFAAASTTTATAGVSAEVMRESIPKIDISGANISLNPVAEKASAMVKRSETLSDNEQRALEMYLGRKHRVKDILEETKVHRSTLYRKVLSFAPSS